MIIIENKIIMTQEDKELLLRDLYTRVPYGIHAKVKRMILGEEVEYAGKVGIDIEFSVLQAFPYKDDIDIKPYLRPMSSITEEEKKEILSILEIGGDIYDNGDIALGCEYGILTLSTFKRYITELNKRMFDVCHLIDKKLALEAPEGMYK